MKNLLLACALALPLLGACQSTSTAVGPRVGIDVQVADGVGVIAFVRSAPLQDVTLIGFAITGRVRVLDLSTGLVLFEGIGRQGEILLLSSKGVKTFKHGQPLPLSAARAFAEQELVRNGQTATNAEYGLVFADLLPVAPAPPTL